MKVENLILSDHRGDTLFYAKNVSSNINAANSLLGKRFSFSNLIIEDFYLMISKEEDPKENSLFIFLNDLKEKLNIQNTKGLDISINNLRASNGNFKLSDMNSGDTNLIQNIEFIFNEIKFKNNNLLVDLEQLKFLNDLLNVETIKSKIEYFDKVIQFKQLNLLTSESHILGNGAIDLTEFDSIGLNGLNLNFNLNEVKVSDNEISRILNESIKFSPLIGNLKFNGNINDIKISNFELESKDLLLNAKGHLKNILDNNFEIKSNIESLYFSSNGYEKLLKPLVNPIVLKEIKNLGNVNLNGSVTLNNKNINGDLFLSSEKGNIISSVNADLNIHQKELFFSKIYSDLNFQKFDLSSFIEGLEEINGKVNLTANGTLSNVSLINLNTDFASIKYLSKIFKNIKSFTEKTIDGYENKIAINDKDLKIDLSISSEYETDKLSHTGLIKIDKVYLNNLTNNQTDKELNLSGNILINYSGTQVDNLSGVLNFQDFKFQGEYSDFTFTDFSIENFLKSKYREIEIKNSNAFSGKIHGDYYITDLKKIFSNFLGEIYQPLSENKYVHDQDLSFQLRVDNNFIKNIYPRFKGDEEITFDGKISTLKNNSSLNLYLPFFKYNEFNIIGLNLKIDTGNVNYKASILADEIKTKNYSFKNLKSFINKSNRPLNLILSFDHGEKFKNQIAINSNYIYRNGISFLEIENSEILFKNNLWKINPDKSGTISYDHNNKKFLVDSFKANISDEEISFSGGYYSEKDFDLKLKINNVSIDKISPDFDRFKLQGILNSSVELKRSITDNTLKIALDADNFHINNDKIGDISIVSTGNTQINSYGIKMFIKKNDNKTLVGNGSIIGIDMNPRLDIDLDFNQFDLKFLSPIGKDNIKNIRGEVTGNVNLWGPITSPYHTGKLILNNSGLKVNYINANYDFIDGAEVSLINQSFNFKNTKFIDSKFKTQAFMSGEIDHMNFKDWNFNLKINSDRIMMIDIPKNEDAIFYGNGFFKGDIVLSGPSKNLNIDVKGETQKGTIINIPWAEDYGIIDPTFIDFKDKSKVYVNLPNENNFKGILGLEMDFELDIDSDAEIAIVIDNESGSFLKGKGGGNILMEINTKGKFNIWGDYIISEGIYNFKNLSLIDKKFELMPGGTITWEGDPYSAIMNIDAIYKVPGGANPALLLDNPNFNKKIPTDVIIKLQGNLLKPDDPIFQINFPNASGVVKSEINYRLSDPQISQLQAISLLSQGIFISEVSVSVQGITNNLYEKASDILSSLIGSNEGKLIFGVNYLQGDKSKYLDLDSEDRLGLTLSTQITDKILINGEIGVPFGGVEETLIVGDVQIDFILNQDGSLKAKVFNKENEFRYIGDELGYTQGVGLSYDVDFETFSELLSIIIKRKK